MIRANVGLSRKLSKDFNSTGFNITIDGEITASINEPNAVIDQVNQLFELAEEVLDQQIERHQNGDSSKSIDTPTSSHPLATNRSFPNGSVSNNRPTSVATSKNSVTAPAPATDKQIQFLLTIAKRQKMTTSKLEQRIAEVLNKSVGIYDLTKADAGKVISTLTNENPSNSNNQESESQNGVVVPF